MKKENKWLGDKTKRKERVHLRTTEDAKSIYHRFDVPYHIGFEYYAYEVLMKEVRGETVLRQKIKEAISLRRMLDIQVESIIETSKDLGIDLTKDNYESWLINQEIASILQDFERDKRFSKIEDFVLSRYEKNRCIADTLNLTFEEFKKLIIDTYEADKTLNLDPYVERTPEAQFKNDFRLLKKNIENKLKDGHKNMSLNNALLVNHKRIKNLAELGVMSEEEIMDLLNKEFRGE